MCHSFYLDLHTAVLGNLAKPPKAQTVTEHVQLLILIIFGQLSMLNSGLQLTAHTLFLQDSPKLKIMNAMMVVK